jgi:hypothetical protein
MATYLGHGGRNVMSFLDEGPEVDFDDLYKVWQEVARLEQMVYNQESILGVTRAGYHHQWNTLNR